MPDYRAADGATVPDSGNRSSRRAILKGIAASGAALPAALVAPQVLGAARVDPIAVLRPPICRVADNVIAPAVNGARRPIKFAWSGTGICTSSIPVAYHRGYFAKHGLDVEIVNFSGNQDQMLESIATGKTDAGVSFALQWLKPLEQEMQVSFTTGVHGGCIRLLVAKSSGITKLAQLCGKRIGATSMVAAAKNFYSIQLVKLGIDPLTGVDWRPYPADLLGLALQKGEIDAIADADPSVYLTEKHSNGALITIDTNLEGPYRDLSCCVLGIRNSLISEERQTAAAITQAILNAAEHVANDPDDAATVFSKYSTAPVPDLVAMLRSHTHHHHPPTPELKAELAVYIADMKLINVLKASTDPARFSGKIYANVFV